MKHLLLFIALLMSPAFLDSCKAQDYIQNDSVKYIVTKNDGTRFIGYILNQDEREVVMMTDKLGKVAIPKHEISSIVAVSKESNNISEDENRLHTRHFLTTSAFPLKKENIYLHLTWFSLLEAEFAISKNFSLGVMTTWIAMPFAITPKLAFKVTDNFHIGGGAIIGTLGWIRLNTGLGLAYGVGTIGNSDDNISISAGYGFAWSNWEFNNYESVILSIGANKRISKKFGFVFDSLLLPNENFYLVMPGIRWFKKPGNYWSFGLGGLVLGLPDVQTGAIKYNSVPMPLPMLQYTLFLKD